MATKALSKEFLVPFIPQVLALCTHCREVVATQASLPTLSADAKFLLVYVTLSRVRRLSDLISVNLTNEVRKIMERGPPDNLLG